LANSVGSADGFFDSNYGGAKMNMVPVMSKQIAYVHYDEQASQMILQYHTGQIQTFANVKKEEYQMVLSSPNRYDWIVKLTKLHTPAKSPVG
jgi:hypothetical protein